MKMEKIPCPMCKKDGGKGYLLRPTWENGEIVGDCVVEIVPDEEYPIGVSYATRFKKIIKK